MNQRGFLAYGAAMVGITLLTAGATINSMVFVYQYAGGITALGALGWLLSSLGPISLSVLVWLIDQRIKARWLPHLIFIAAAILAFRTGSFLYFHEAGIFVASMASDFALLTAAGYLVLALLIHIVAFGASAIASFRLWANDR